MQNITNNDIITMQEALFVDKTISPQILAIPEELDHNLHVIVVPYFETTNPEWQVLYTQADRNPGVIKYVIINPCSGPCGESLPLEWQQVISELKKRNIKTLGYIFDTAQSIANIDYYMKAQTPTDGIFFDNEGSSDTLDRFRQYAEYVHDLDGVVYINPGFNYPHLSKYADSGLVDVINAYEFESSKLHHIEIDRVIDPKKMSAILGDVHSYSEMMRMVNETAEEGIGLVYVYSDSYYRLPPFFSEMLKLVATTKVQTNYLEP